jgi:hypothetical protein
MESKGIVQLTLITGRAQRAKLTAALATVGGLLIETIYGRGSVKASWLQGALGFAAEEEKAIITCLISRAHADTALQMLSTDFGFNKPNTGIAFTTPVDAISV